MPVLTGLDRLREDAFSCLRGEVLGLLCHPASVDSNLNHVLELMDGAGLDIQVVFGPEHGVSGSAQDMESINSGFSSTAHAPVSTRRLISLYGDSLESLRPSADMVEGLSVLVVDLQDVGSRYYTFAVTMRYCMEVCAKVGVRVVVLDRPNPLGGLTVEGPVLGQEPRSFVGGFGVPVRHGLTMGELAMLATREGVDVELQVISMKGWNRGMWFDDTGLEWVLPSPNMPTLETAIVYPGSCLIEATNLSEGRGTTRPFEFVGAPWIDSSALASNMNSAGLTGVRFRPTSFRPMFQKHARQDCHGVQIHVLDRKEFQPFRCGVILLDELRRQNQELFQWRSQPYEFVKDPPALDLLTGSDELRMLLEQGGDTRSVLSRWEKQSSEFAQAIQDSFLYD